MKTVGFVLHPAHAESRALFEEARAFLEDHGSQAIELATVESVSASTVQGRPYRRLSEPSVDTVVSLGGDGTMLRAMACAHRQGVPALGINLGQLGYLTEVEPSEMIDALESILTDHFIVEERLALVAEFTIGAEEHAVVAFNEVVVERQVSGHVIRGDVAIDGRRFLRYEADGLIIATPTGSTAYNLSARGPILAPLLQAIVLTPLSPHMLFDRSLVLDVTQAVGFSLDRGPNASVMVDGQVVHTLAAPGSVLIRAHPDPICLIRVTDVPFYDIVKRKFRLNHPEASPLENERA